MKKLWIVSVFTVVWMWMACSQPASKSVLSIDRKNLDTTVSPGTDFYQYANGGWLKNNPIPEAFGSWGSFNELRDQNNIKLHDLLEGAMKANAPKGTIKQKIGDFYASGMDSAGIEAAGLTPLAGEFARIDAIQSGSDLQDVIAHLHHYSMAPMFNFYSDQDAKNSNDVIAQATQGGLTLPERDYYFNMDDKSKSIRAEFLTHMKKMFTLMGQDSVTAEKNAQTVMNIETRLAKASMTVVEQRDPNATYHKMTIEEVSRLTPNFTWTKYLASVGLGEVQSLNVAQPEFFKEVNAMQTAVSLDDWKTYLRWHVINMAAPYLNQAFVEQNFKFNGTVLTGQRALQLRWKRVSNTVDQRIGMALGQLYVEKYFPPRAKAKANEMIGNLKAAMKDHIEKLEWMTDSTKAKAQKKLSTFAVKIGYPDQWRDYTGLEIDRGSYIINIMRADSFEFRRLMAKVGKPVDREDWGMTPPTVNASYNPGLNTITFPAGILQWPFFNPDADDAFNYGCMGAVIGHEITHGFDDEGRQYDAEGNLKDWWLPEDEKQFNLRAKLVEEQFNQFVAVDSLHVNGKLTLGENLADLAGLTIAYDAMKKSMEGKPAPAKIDGFTAEQRFFLAWAQIWRVNMRDQTLRLLVTTDPHAPGKFRVNGPFANMKQFQEAFGLSDNDPMIRPDSLRVVIW
ncbi:M13 family metallopeptidase [bacterium]|nr:M13 family metallopeptidase [bacterium]